MPEEVKDGREFGAVNLYLCVREIDVENERESFCYSLRVFWHLDLRERRTSKRSIARRDEKRVKREGVGKRAWD